MNTHTALRNLRIAVLFGGHSGEREVSIASSRTVIAALEEGGYAPALIDTGEPIWWAGLSDIDLAFNIQHGIGGEDGVSQGLLESMGVVGTGSTVLGSALAMDKLRSKQLWRAVGLPTADFQRIDANTDFSALLARWGEAFVKPANGGSSLGMSRVRSTTEFAEAYAQAARYDATVMAEQFINGPEYTVAILGTRSLPVIRIEAAGEFYDYDAKYLADTTRYQVPCGLEADKERQLQALAQTAFHALGCSIWGRVDLMQEPTGGFVLLEANTIPGMTDHSLVPMAASAAGLTMLELLEEIMQLSWQAGPDASGGER